MQHFILEVYQTELPELLGCVSATPNHPRNHPSSSTELPELLGCVSATPSHSRNHPSSSIAS